MSSTTSTPPLSLEEKRTVLIPVAPPRIVANRIRKLFEHLHGDEGVSEANPEDTSQRLLTQALPPPPVYTTFSRTPLDMMYFSVLCAERNGSELGALRAVEDYDGLTVETEPHAFGWYNVMTDSWTRDNEYLSPDLGRCQRHCIDLCDAVIAFQSRRNPDSATHRACQYAVYGQYDNATPLKSPIVPYDNVQVVTAGTKPVLVIWDLDQHKDAFELSHQVARWLVRVKAQDLFISGVTQPGFEEHVYRLFMRAFRYWEDPYASGIHMDMFPPSLGVTPQDFLNLEPEKTMR